MRSDNSAGICVHRFPRLARRRLVHAVSDRFGGVSVAPCDTLNLGLHVGDAPAAVIENRRRLCAAAGLDARKLIVAEQVHGAHVQMVGHGDCGRGALDHRTAVESADGLVCAEAGVPLMALSADCPLVLLFDPGAPVLALIHAGWRGLAAGVLSAAVETMASAGADKARTMAGIGPCIGPCCYEVADDLLTAVRCGLPAASSAISEAHGRMFFDLPGAVAGELHRLGLGVENIETAGICTSCEAQRFFSHRASGGSTGRFAMLAQIICPQ